MRMINNNDQSDNNAEIERGCVEFVIPSNVEGQP